MIHQKLQLTVIRSNVSARNLTGADYTGNTLSKTQKTQDRASILDFRLWEWGMQREYSDIMAAGRPQQ